VVLAGKDADAALKIVEMLEDCDDVQNVWSNFDLDEETAKRLNEAA
jgi:transcriptional/translational regulatory protein YebC/TACO1